MKIQHIVLVSFGVVCAACGPALTMEGARVKVAPGASDMASCQNISNVDVTAGSTEAAEIMLRNKAGTLNADNVVVTETIENAGQVKLVGKAYSCSAAQSGMGNTGS